MAYFFPLISFIIISAIRSILSPSDNSKVDVDVACWSIVAGRKPALEMVVISSFFFSLKRGITIMRAIMTITTAMIRSDFFITYYLAYAYICFLTQSPQIPFIFTHFGHLHFSSIDFTLYEDIIK